jgi:hypothetical protein
MNSGLNDTNWQEPANSERHAWVWPDTAYPLPINPCVWTDKQSQSRAAVLEVLIAEKQLQNMHSQTKQSEAPGTEE